MNRREFVRLAGSGLPAVALAEEVTEAQVAQSRAAPAPAGRQRALMKVGTQHGDTEEILKACAAFGVNNICSSLPSEKMDDKLIDFGYRAVHETDVQSRAVVRAFYGREP